VRVQYGLVLVSYILFLPVPVKGRFKNILVVPGEKATILLIYNSEAKIPAGLILGPQNGPHNTGNFIAAIAAAIKPCLL
jgi:hypothetical protein